MRVQNRSTLKVELASIIFALFMILLLGNVRPNEQLSKTCFQDILISLYFDEISLAHPSLKWRFDSAHVFVKFFTAWHQYFCKKSFGEYRCWNERIICISTFRKILLQHFHLHCDWRCQGEDDGLASWLPTVPTTEDSFFSTVYLLPCVLVFLLGEFLFQSLVLFPLYFVRFFQWFSFCLMCFKISTGILMAEALCNTGVNTSIMILAVQSNVDTSIMVRFHSK